MPTPAAETAFLAPILARYHDDGPRLVYADFLDESDDPADRGRADLVRVQCALARLPAHHPRRPPLADRAAELLRTFLTIWTDRLRYLAVGFEFRRGLLDAVSVDAATFLDRGAELFRLAPVRRVRLLDAARFADRLADCPHLAHVRELDLCGNDLGSGGVNVLLRSPYLKHVEDLDLSFNGVGDAGVRALARATTLPRLRGLHLTDNGGITGDGVQALAESSHVSELRELDVSGNDVSDGGVRAVVGSPHLARLHTLRVYANPIGDAGVIALAGSSLLGRMLARGAPLDLRQTGLGPEGAAALADAPPLAAATDLDVSGNALGDDGLRSLAGSPHLPQLRRLAVRRNHVGDRGAVALARSPVMGRLNFLDVSANRLTRRGVDALWANRKDFRTVLEAGGNLVSDPAPGETPASLGEEVARVLDRYVDRPPAGRPLPPRRPVV